MKKFYDTNVLLNLLEKAFEEHFICSSKTLEEIENIKVSNKDEEVKYKARKLSKLFNENDNYDIIIGNYKDSLKQLEEFGLKETPDNLIMLDAYNCKDVIFYTEDICCKNIAKNIFGLKVCSLKDDRDDDYKGFREVTLTDEELAYLYSHLDINQFDLFENEYLIIKNENDVIIDKFVFKDGVYDVVKFSQMKSDMFGNVKPYEGDIYQQMAINSMYNNKLTVLKGSAGTGKSYLALGYLFSQLEKRKIDKIIIFCNTVATANSAKLGFYPGTKDEKLLDSQIGNMLSAKFGKILLEEFIRREQILLLPMSDIRGFDTSGMNAGIYITEAQNMDISLMKLALQRIGEDCVCIIDGDYNAQVDMSQYSGVNNGMRRLSEIFRGQEFYGEIELQNIYRSRIARIADMM